MIPAFVPDVSLPPTPRRRFGRMALQGVLLCVFLVGGLLPSQAQQSPFNELERLGQDWAQSHVQTLPGDASRPPLRIEIVPGQIDPRLQLTPCANIEPFIPTGAVLWGRTRIGLRCASGPTRWQIFMPLTVRALGPVWTLRTTLPVGTVITSEHLQASQGDWAEQPSSVAVHPADWEGKMLSRTVSGGEILRLSMLRPRQLFPTGASVRVLLQSPGFEISQEGQALGPGHEGESVRVRLENGKILNGVVKDSKTVKVNF